MLHYSFGFLVWLRGKIKASDDYCGNVIRLERIIEEDVNDGEHRCIVNINGIDHELMVRPLKNQEVIRQAESFVNG